MNPKVGHILHFSESLAVNLINICDYHHEQNAYYSRLSDFGLFN